MKSDVMISCPYHKCGSLWTLTRNTGGWVFKIFSLTKVDLFKLGLQFSDSKRYEHWRMFCCVSNAAFPFFFAWRYLVLILQAFANVMCQIVTASFVIFAFFASLPRGSGVYCLCCVFLLFLPLYKKCDLFVYQQYF